MSGDLCPCHLTRTLLSTTSSFPTLLTLTPVVSQHMNVVSLAEGVRVRENDREGERESEEKLVLLLSLQIPEVYVSTMEKKRGKIQYKEKISFTGSGEVILTKKYHTLLIHIILCIKKVGLALV